MKRKVLIKGTPASPGVSTGDVVIVLNSADFQKIKGGEIMVCPMTLPSWLPYMVKVSAIVTNFGGKLSHAAIVCREFGIPAIVGTQDATETLRDGQRVTADGTSGTVYE